MTLRTSKLRQYRDQARIQAVKAAKEKALALAGELGAKVGKAHSMTEGSHDMSIGMGGGEGAANPACEAGTISSSATVTVAFVLE